MVKMSAAERAKGSEAASHRRTVPDFGTVRRGILSLKSDIILTFQKEALLQALRACCG
jgi:hypothetical protein